MRQNELTATFSYGVLYLFMAVQLYHVLLLCRAITVTGDTKCSLFVFFFEFGAIFQIHINCVYYTGYKEKLKCGHGELLVLLNAVFTVIRVQFTQVQKSSFFTVVCSGNCYIFLLSFE